MCYALRAEPLMLRGAEEPEEAGRRTIGVPLEAPFTMGRIDEDLKDICQVTNPSNIIKPVEIYC